MVKDLDVRLREFLGSNRFAVASRVRLRRLGLRLWNDQERDHHAQLRDFNTAFWASPVKVNNDEVCLPENVDSKALAVYSRYGYFPISFSWPGCLPNPKDERQRLLSIVRPLVAYSFSEPETYYAEYRNSLFALT